MLTPNIYLRNDVKDNINGVDSIIFDCDGVLIDITNSYDLAIKKTVGYILKKIFNTKIHYIVTHRIIDSFKATGGFNDEVDVVYAIILAFVAAKKSNKHNSQFIYEIIANSDNTGIKSVEKYIKMLQIDISHIIEKLGYPYNPNNILCSIFDQFFYGSELYYSIYKKKPELICTGFIKNDKLIVTRYLLLELKRKFNDKIAIVTGRGIQSIKYSLRDLLYYFNVNNSMFLDDESRKLAKPNPISLINSINRLNSSHCLYIGDSIEDLIMADKATQLGFKTTFCGIFGCSNDQDNKIKLFKGKNVELILKSIDHLPNVLNLIKK